MNTKRCAGALTYHRDMAADRCELKSPRKKLSSSSGSVALFRLAKVNDERSGGSTDIVDEEGSVVMFTIELCDENSDTTKRTETITMHQHRTSGEYRLESGEVEALVSFSSMIGWCLQSKLKCTWIWNKPTIKQLHSPLFNRSFAFEGRRFKKRWDVKKNRIHVCVYIYMCVKIDREIDGLM